MRPVLGVVAVLVVLPSLAAAGPATPEIVAIYPDPVAEGDAGEFVVLDVPAGANGSAYALSDGESTVPLPAVAPGRVAFVTDSARAARLAGYRTQPLPAPLRLSNAGERLVLRQNGRPVDVLEYAETEEGAVLDGTREWRPLGATDRPVVTAGPGRVRAFVLPDAGGLPTEVLAGANDRILLAGYTLTSATVTRSLVRAARRNVSVRVLLDAEPVGGMARSQVRRLDRLARAGVNVTVVGGPHARYRFHHAKYAVVDDRALVTTENWKPAGTGGHASRGWGVVTNQSRIVGGLAATFRADAGWLDGLPWRAYRHRVDPVASNASTGEFGRAVEPARLPVEETRLLVAPDNAEAAVVDLLRGADESIWIEQAGVGGPGQPFVRAAVAAARRGVTVRLLLGSAWYNERENRAVAERLRAIADREGLDLRLRLVRPRGRFDRLHAKAAVIDGERVLLGSLNWNNNSARHNREVALVLRGEAVGAYFGDVVRADWRGGDRRVLLGLAIASVAAVVAAGRVARGVRFEAAGGGPGG